MAQNPTEKTSDKMDEISIKDFFIKISSAVNYLKKNWITILIVGLLGAALGLVYAMVKKPLYKASCTFVLESENSGGTLSQYAGLASLAGIDLQSGGGSIFSSDNIMALYTSRLMIEKALLSEVTFTNKKQLLIDRYIDFNKLRSAWKDNNHINNITFYGDPLKFNRIQDSIITDMVFTVNKKMLDVSKPDKKLSIIEVDVKSADEEFSKEFTDKLVENVNDFYVKTKTQKTYQNMMSLQKQADSVRLVLNSAMNGYASAVDAAPNANPALSTLRVPSQKKQIDVQANSAIYSEIVKNLEISKISLRQEKPLIQIIDKPVLPLAVDRLSKLKGIILGFILGCIIATGYIITKKVLHILIS